VFIYVLRLLFTLNRVKTASNWHLTKSSVEGCSFLHVQDSSFVVYALLNGIHETFCRILFFGSSCCYELINSLRKRTRTIKSVVDDQHWNIKLSAPLRLIFSFFPMNWNFKT